MIIRDLNNAEVLLVKSEKVCEFLVDKQNRKIIQTKNMTEVVNMDITSQCIDTGCEYIIDSQGNMFIDYKVCNILAKLLNSDVDVDCIEFLGKLNFDVAFY